MKALLGKRMSRGWSIIRHSPASGSWNMAVDEALLASVDRGPVFRIYGWEDWSLSLGRFQDPRKDLRSQFLSAPGFPMVRRMTGGGAILHGQEITYSLVLRQEDLGTKSVHQSFEILCGVLIRFYGNLGFQAQFAKDIEQDKATLGQKTPFCFAGKELYDLTISGKKIGGNAQRRFKDVIFQHGSIPIHLNLGGLERVFPSQALPAPQEITSLGELGIQSSWEALAGELEKAFRQELPAISPQLERTPEQRSLIPEESSRAQKLEESVYQSHHWTMDKTRPS